MPTTQEQRITELMALGYELVAGIAGQTPAVHMVKRTVSGRYGAIVAQTGASHYTRPDGR